MERFVETPADISGILKPGVYLLSYGGKVVFVGRARCLLATLAGHRAVASGPRMPEWFPIKRITFDSIAILPTSYDRTLELAQALIEFHKPPRNLHVNPPGSFLPPNLPPRPASTIVRRV